ncbi:MATE family efflux transporter [Anaerosalibacter bizertensis]|uniref:Multidrug export protein MepA n=1 Tax=Anaerosalibacter bizertensis TaxID=932217 RepID=A0A9Q4AAW2_9FIRM|nr:MATE family efflux transporter [Anaerosalibacter bizertensis]MBV1818725.1 MATE family efflux transporter [Bacteroidales bacterium MSK.15.36]MCB5558824.1 MATE family efflux transporter [Anaerosalibacter bizertensis]MCG4564168.1 MATE family efflux transporter [Anaerosalibacter bizertensis]MCG4581851.1 MATE family efflux transporter [Anaerosalibacter bizertensis]MCG4585441.1 MATE family efflux transporter [Anaerosalibacter bizertensis]
MNEENRLGTENVKSLLFSLAIPAIIGQLISLLYNIVDRMYIGHIPEIGGDALTGVGVTAPILIIISAFSVLVGMGGAPRASIKMGEKDNEGAEEIMGNCFVSLIGISIILTVLFSIFNEKLLVIFGASEKTLPYALEYMKIYTLGTIFVQLAVGMNPFISSQGFAKISMITVSIGAIINIVLDPIFIYGLKMNVKGAALATVISQGISAIWVIHFLRGDRTNLKLKKENFKINRHIMGPVLLLGLSPFVMQITESFIIIAFNFNLQKYGGDVAVGAMTILSAAMQFTFLPLSGLTQGAQPIMSYNYGAKNKERMKDTFKYLCISTVTYSTVFWLFIMIAPQLFSKIFTNDKAIIDMATQGLRIYMAGAFALGIQIACQQTFIALGNARTSLFLALLRKVFLLIPLVLILPNILSNKVFAVFLAEPISDIIAATVTGILFYKDFSSTLRSMPNTPSYN